MPTHASDIIFWAAVIVSALNLVIIFLVLFLLQRVARYEEEEILLSHLRLPFRLPRN
jgi:hypothetical protein